MEFEEQKILELFENLGTNQSTGPNMFGSVTLRHAVEKIKNFLNLVFQTMINKGIFFVGLPKMEISRTSKFTNKGELNSLPSIKEPSNCFRSEAFGNRPKKSKLGLSISIVSQ